MSAHPKNVLESYTSIKAVEDVLAERIKQVDKGYTPEHDDDYKDDELTMAAICYLELGITDGVPANTVATCWPWDVRTFKPRDQRSNLVRGIALAIASLERMDREAERVASEAGESCPTL